MSRRRILPRDSSLLWQFSYFTFSLVQRLFYRIAVEGLDNVPARGSVVLAANHTTYHDIFILGCTSPRQIHFMAKQELFDSNWFLSMYLTRAGVFPVRRGENDRKAIATALSHLKDGRVLGMFPEGKRYPALRRGKSGVARLAIKTNTPIVPIGIVGAKELDFRRRLRQWRRDRIVIRYGEPILIAAQRETTGSEQDLVQKVTTEMMHKIAGLIPAELRGVYADDLALEEEGSA